MKSVKLTQPTLVGTVNHPAGAIVKVSDDRARDLISGGHAESHDESAQVANADHNPFADVIEPEPPGGLVINPVDALAPNVQDNPGLKKIAELTASKGKSTRVKAGDLVAPDDQAAQVEPTTTANELIPATKAE